LNYAGHLIHANILRLRSMSARSPEGRGGHRIARVGASSPYQKGSPARPMPSVQITPLQFNPEYCVVARRHDALGTRGRWVVFASLAGLSLAFALGFAAAGAWLVLPYSVLELTLVAVAFVCIERRSGNWERLTVAENSVVVERRRAATVSRREFNRWRVRVEAAVADARATPRLVLHCAGERFEFGGDLPTAERLAVARELRRLTRLR
jgi:uncharacterized membrane protein